MIKNKFLVSIMLLLLLTLQSCAVEELENSSNPKLDIVTKNVNPLFLKHDLTPFNIKPVWSSAFNFKDIDAVEVAYFKNGKMDFPLSDNKEIKGRQRLLLSIKNGVIQKTIIEYYPDNNYTGNIKELNCRNFKQKKFSGKIAFTTLGEQNTVYWFMNNGTLKAKGYTKKQNKKTAKTKYYVDTWVTVCNYHTTCVGGDVGNEAVYTCTTFETCGEVLYSYWVDEETPPGEDPPGEDPFSCDANPSWPWCQGDGSGDSDGDIGGSTTTESIIIDNPVNFIGDMNDYLKCFNLDQSARIIIYVDQPIANSSEAWSIKGSGSSTGGIINAGHSYIAIQQGDNRMVLGFYPETSVSNTQPSTNGSFGNDENTEFDVSISAPITSTQLMDIIGYCETGFSYNLNTFNCTDFVVQISNLSGLNLPESESTWPNGGGSNPGLLGQNIREMQLPTDSVRQTTTANSALNRKTCQ